MTSGESPAGSNRPVGRGDWIWDSSALLHHVQADRCPDLLDLARVAGRQHLLTSVVAAELEKHAALRKALTAGWRLIDDPEDDPLDARGTLIELAAQLDVRGLHNLGEATVLAVAEQTGATAVVDDRDAHTVGRSRGVAVIRTLRIIGDAVDSGQLTSRAANAWVSDLDLTGARLPSAAVADFAAWWATVRSRL